MIAAVNDDQQPIDEVLAHYFNRENYVTWLAVNVLMADFDSISQNFMLYSPPGFEGWYLLPWDYDVAWGWSDQPGAPPRPRWREGVANWWRVVLHQRFLAEPGNLAELDARIVELTGTINDANTAAMHGPIPRSGRVVRQPAARHQRPSVRQPRNARSGLAVGGGIRARRGQRQPRVRGIRDHGQSPDAVLALRAEVPVTRKREVLVEPFVPAARGTDQLRHRGQRERKFRARVVLATATGLSEPGFTITTLPPGRHFWRVVARAATDPNRHWQAAHNGHLFVDVPVSGEAPEAIGTPEPPAAPGLLVVGPGRLRVGLIGLSLGSRRRGARRTAATGSATGQPLASRAGPLAPRTAGAAESTATPRARPPPPGPPPGRPPPRGKPPPGRHRRRDRHRADHRHVGHRPAAGTATAARTAARADRRRQDRRRGRRQDHAPAPPPPGPPPGRPQATTRADRHHHGPGPPPGPPPVRPWRPPPRTATGPPIRRGPDGPDHCPSGTDRAVRAEGARVHHPARTADRTVGSTATLAALGRTKGKATAGRTTAGAAAKATATATAAAAATSTTAGASAAVTTASRTTAIAIAVLGLGARHQIDDVVEIALLLGAGGRILAAHHAHEADVVGAIANHLERLHQAGEAIPLDVELRLNLGRASRGAPSTTAGAPVVDGRLLRAAGAASRHLRPRLRRLRPAAASDAVSSAGASPSASAGAAAASAGASPSPSAAGPPRQPSRGRPRRTPPRRRRASRRRSPRAVSDSRFYRRGFVACFGGASAGPRAASPFGDGALAGAGGGAGRWARRIVAASRNRMPGNSVTVFMAS